MAIAVVPLCGENEKQVRINFFTLKQLLKQAQILTCDLTMLSLGTLVLLISEPSDPSSPRCQVCIEKGHHLWPEGE